MTLPFQTTPDERQILDDISCVMRSIRIDESFVKEARAIAENCQGAFDLMSLWYTANSADEREKALADLHTVVLDWRAIGSYG